jgi:hypothetical protein
MEKVNRSRASIAPAGPTVLAGIAPITQSPTTGAYAALPPFVHPPLPACSPSPRVSRLPHVHRRPSCYQVEERRPESLRGRNTIVCARLHIPSPIHHFVRLGLGRSSLDLDLGSLVTSKTTSGTTAATGAVGVSGWPCPISCATTLFRLWPPAGLIVPVAGADHRLVRCCCTLITRELRQSVRGTDRVAPAPARVSVIAQAR